MPEKTTKGSRLRQKFERFTLRPQTQEEIKRLRKKWKIPQKGFKGNYGSLKWQNWLMDATDAFYVGEEYKKMRKKIITVQSRIEKTRSENLREDYDLLNKLQIEINAAIPINAFHNDVIELRKIGNLSNAFSDTMKWYLLNNNIHSIKGPSVGIRTNAENIHKDEMYVNIYPETTLKDIEKMWWMVKFHQRGRLGSSMKRLKNYPKLERDKRIVELSQQDMAHYQIAEQVNIEFDENLIYNDIPKILRKIKKYIL